MKTDLYATIVFPVRQFFFPLCYPPRASSLDLIFDKRDWLHTAIYRYFVPFNQSPPSNPVYINATLYNINRNAFTQMLPTLWVCYYAAAIMQFLFLHYAIRVKITHSRIAITQFPLLPRDPVVFGCRSVVATLRFQYYSERYKYPVLLSKIDKRDKGKEKKSNLHMLIFELFFSLEK